MNKNESVLLELIKASLFGAEPHFDPQTDWRQVLEEAKAQTVVALVAGAVPGEFASMWEIPAARNKAYFMRALHEQTLLVQLFSAAGIAFVILKGTVAAYYYPKPVERTMGDIDVLVTEECFETAFSLLEQNGYRFEQDYGDGRDYAFTKNGVVFELHRRYSDPQYDMEEFLRDGIAHAETLSLYEHAFPALPKAPGGLVLLDHIRHHLAGGLGIRQIIDWAMFVREVPCETFEKEVLPLLERAGLGTFARVVTKMCKLYFGLSSNTGWCEQADEQTCSQLLEHLLASGNFASKTPYVYRPMRGLTQEVQKNGFFKTLQHIGMENAPIFKKNRFLRPFAWIYQLFRFCRKGIVALLSGEKLLSDVAAGKEEADFNRRLGLK